MTRDQAKMLIADLRQTGVSDGSITNRLLSEGFSYRDVSDLLALAPKQKRKNSDLAPYAQEKMKNDYNPYAYNQFERGGCLSAWLGLQGIGAVFAIGLAIFLFLSASTSPDVGFSMFLGGLLIILGIAQFACVAWLWDGQRKGYQGLMALLVLNLIFGGLGGDISSIAGGVVAIVILFMLVNPKEGQLR
ncbi:MAG: hypothetical protein AAF846_20865 [Chloroflexota bacterium]